MAWISTIATLQLPDVARDPVVQSYAPAIQGIFILLVKDAATGNPISDARVELPIAAQYTRPVIIGAAGPDVPSASRSH